MAVLNASFSQTEKNNCNRFKTGTFALKGDENVLVIRTENFQVEWDKKAMNTSWYKIKWINNCTYTTTLVKADNSDEIILKGIPVTIEILETGEKSYKYKISTSEYKVEDFGEMIAI
jgi:hypothetical protein